MTSRYVPCLWLFINCFSILRKMGWSHLWLYMSWAWDGKEESKRRSLCCLTRWASGPECFCLSDKVVYEHGCLVLELCDLCEPNLDVVAALLVCRACEGHVSLQCFALINQCIEGNHAPEGQSCWGHKEALHMMARSASRHELDRVLKSWKHVHTTCPKHNNYMILHQSTQTQPSLKPRHLAHVGLLLVVSLASSALVFKVMLAFIALPKSLRQSFILSHTSMSS